MEVRNVVQEIYRKIDIPFTPDEYALFRSFLKATGRKAGPWVRTLILRAMDAADRVGDGSGQARELAEALAGSTAQPDEIEVLR